MSNVEERTPLIADSANRGPSGAHPDVATSYARTEAYLASIFVLIFIVTIVIAGVIIGDGFPKDPMEAAIAILQKAPIIVSIQCHLAKYVRTGWVCRMDI